MNKRSARAAIKLLESEYLKIIERMGSIPDELQVYSQENTDYQAMIMAITYLKGQIGDE